ncbi:MULTISPECIES: hypothetical protein [unclassified Microbacterium]|uniref:hypothetical protein n=1 Tax=unclassified Microbacterium TaxID=2609290 RepID=UPI00386C8345
MTKRRWERGHSYWALGALLVFAIGILFGLVMQNIWLGLVLAAAVSIGWLIAYESRRGRNQGIYDRDDDGAQL